MKYIGFVAGDGLPTREQVAVMNREIPGWLEEMEARGAHLAGRPLDLPDTAATVRVRDGETLVTDGPFVEAKEFIAGFDLLDCANLDEAIEIEAKAPVAWFMAIEIRPFADGLRLGDDLGAFERREDGGRHPFQLAAWTDGTEPASPGDPAVRRETEAWRQDLADRGLLIVGGDLEGGDTATTLRVRDEKTLLADGPFISSGAFITGLDVVHCPDREQAIQLAATHPAARSHAIEVRPFEAG
ncbi:MAG TPA: YciI family protein [Streptosporangiaceae bacterium]|nr:YciI family protein [Streptosporangiaceae bacterium]